MANWFVDSSATGNNSGTSVANAAIDINSLTVGGQVAFGDRVWVRRTMHWQANSYIVGRSGHNAASHNPIEIIGWPSSGDPHYLERPSAPTWDADGALYAGLPWPTFVTSGTGNQANPTIRNGVRHTNFLFTGSVALTEFNSMNTNWFGTKNTHRHWGKIACLNFKPDGGTGQAFVDEIIWVMSGTAQGAGIENVACRRFVVTQSCVGIPIQTDWLYMNEIVMESNSISQIAIILSQTFPLAMSYIGRIVGFKAKGREFATQLNSDARFPVIIDEWYGEGPRQFSPQVGGPGASVAVSGTAVRSGQATWVWNNSASNINVEDGGLITDLHNSVEHVGQYISTQSGTPITATMFFFYAGATGSLDGNRNGWMQLTGPGGGVQRISGQQSSGGLYADNPAFWTGNSVQAGSAYYSQFKWTPTDTATAYLSGRVPLPINFAYVTSGSIFVAPFFTVTTG